MKKGAEGGEQLTAGAKTSFSKLEYDIFQFLALWLQGVDPTRSYLSEVEAKVLRYLIKRVQGAQDDATAHALAAVSAAIESD